MDMIAMAREIGKAIQQDERYIKATTLAQQVNTSEELTKLVNEFGDLRAQLEFELAKGDPNGENAAVVEIDAKMHELYDTINAHPVMVDYNAARTEFEQLVNHITHIITGSANGENPDTIEMETCSGSCSTCGGCH